MPHGTRIIVCAVRYSVLLQGGVDPIRRALLFECNGVGVDCHVALAGNMQFPVEPKAQPRGTILTLAVLFDGRIRVTGEAGAEALREHSRRDVDRDQLTLSGSQFRSVFACGEEQRHCAVVEAGVDPYPDEKQMFHQEQV